MEPMTLGSPAGSPAQTQSSPVGNPGYLPSFLLGDNSMTRMGAITPESRYIRTERQSPSTPVSSYASPEYRLNRQKAMFGNSSNSNASQVASESHIGGPPTKGLYESIETRTSSTHCTPLNNQRSSISSPFLDLPLNSSNNESSQSLLQWVTVFGFSPNALNTVLAYISSRVRIVDKHSAAHPQSNWIHLKCSSEQEAQRSLGLNGNIVTGSTMIGIIPCTDEAVIFGVHKENQLKLNDSLRLGSTPIKSLSGISSLHSPKNPIKNARPLMPGYNQQLSSLAVVSPENVPHKSSGIVTKAMEYVFGW